MNIKDIAKISGVSVATVSRVLNGMDNVSEKTRQKVLKVSEKHGYCINFMGRRMKTERSKIILVMLESLSNNFLSKVINSIEKEADRNNINVLVCVTGANRDKENKYINLVRNKMADGIIILNSSYNEEEINKLYKEISLIQCCECVSEKVPYVVMDNYKSAYELTKGIMDKGAKKIAFMSVNNKLLTTTMRYKGYRDAVGKENTIVFYGNYGYRNAIESTKEFLLENSDIDGVVALSDRMASGVVSALKSKGLKVPQDVLVAGFDDTDISYITSPGLTSVAQPHKELGKYAVEMLNKIIENIKVESIILPYVIKERNSTLKEDI